MSFRAVGVFAFILGVLIVTQAHPQFPDPDSFYHAKMAMIIRDQGMIDAFPWLDATALKDTYVNPHFLYHILLIPFVTLFDPLVGMKVSAVAFGFLAFLSVYLFLQTIRAPRPELILLAAALSPAFLHRMSLPRAPALAVAGLMLLTYAMMAKRHRLVFFGSALFVWFYHGWPLLLPTLVGVLVAEVFAAMISFEEPWRASAKRVWSERRATIVAALSGITAGLVVNPYFPQNIAFSVLDIVQIGVVNYQAILPVGGEWYPFTLSELVTGGVAIFLLFGLTLALFVPGVSGKRDHSREEIARTFTMFLLFAGYFLLTLKSRRYIEYAIPYLALTIGALAPYSFTFFSRELLPSIRAWWQKRRYCAALLGAGALLTLSVLAVNEVRWIAPENDYYAAHQYAPAAEWIRKNVPPGEIIFHNSWDYSLVLFYLDDTHRYLVGLDPTFMYDHDQVVYERWRSLISGEEKDVSLIRSEFDSRVVVIDTRVKEAEDFRQNVERSGLFQKVVENEWIYVYAALPVVSGVEL